MRSPSSSLVAAGRAHTVGGESGRGLRHDHECRHRHRLRRGCSASVEDGTQVTLQAAADEGSVFEGWSGTGVSCVGTGPCTVTVTEDTTVVGTFRRSRGHSPSPSKVLAQARSSARRPASTAGRVCSAVFPHASLVTLTATPDDRIGLRRWTGACGGTGDCVVTMDADQTVSATFDVPLPAVDCADADPAVAYGGWRESSMPAASGGAYRMSSVKDEKATGARRRRLSITWIARTGPDRGIASVTIDGTNKGTVDLYAP